MQSIFKGVAAGLAMTTLLAGAASAELGGDLRIFFDDQNPAPKAAIEGTVERFQAMHPDMNIELTLIDREANKTQIRNYLTANAPDINGWYAGNRMRPYVEAGLFEDVSDLWDGQLGEELASTRAAMTIDGKQWGVPYTYYQWGIYYRQDIYEELGLTPATTWEEEKANCQVILDSGRKCYTIGTRFLWTAGGWFDYLNLRTNGYDFHMALTAGEIPWTDQRVRDTFANWRELLDMGAFIDDHTAYSWQEAQPFMVNGEAAAYLMGNFVVAPMREAGLTDDQLGFYQFPEITPGIPMAEDAPTDTLHIPAQAENKENARAFLRYMASAENQGIVNETLGQLPVNRNATVPDDKFIQAGFELLSNAEGGIAQFFDRDASAEMASAGMQGFQEFMVLPDNLDAILDRLEQVRQRLNAE
ncbi:Multiple sugar-binding protein [Roseibaca ekhonensis]|jgi:multiple sugar transport system substrate-binding protein|uniref:Multiple sugar-binding protein n=1 Tax=Roseinatronobacter ekhonensis TaxID=254356 RepID=A0A3B0MGW1_9RHOB|nr:ABC transporter substrate-binding protein [Roseibaca ekhonensis]SUZ32758.1 Multiple sugar-binding protein [Roseibaca ekhonensis]